MDERKLVVWFIGGNSVGKTTQARALHGLFSDLSRNKPNVIHKELVRKGVKLMYTVFNLISVNLGRLGATACGGTDTLSTKAQIQGTFEYLVEETDFSVIIIEGIMATSTWIDFLDREDTEVWLILLDVDDSTNLSRLRQRRGLKRGIDPADVEITEKTMFNLAGKLRGFRSLFAKAKHRCQYADCIDTTLMDIDEVSFLLKTKLLSILAQESV